MLLNVSNKLSNTKAMGSPFDKDNFIFLWRVVLSQLSDQLYMSTGMGCLSYGHGYVVTPA